MITDEPEIVGKFQMLNMETGFNLVEMWKEQEGE